VSNLDPAGRRVTAPFAVQQITAATGRLSAVHPAGQLLHRDELASINRTVEGLCVSGRATPRALAQVLTELVRSVSRGRDARAQRVSEDTLVISMPRPDLVRGNFVVGRLVDDYPSVTHIPKGESRMERHGGPIIVGRNAAVQALPSEDRPPDTDGEFVGLRIIRKPGAGSGLTALILTNPPLGAAWGWPGEAAAAVRSE